jgi:hypothetical protein
MIVVKENVRRVLVAIIEHFDNSHYSGVFLSLT